MTMIKCNWNEDVSYDEQCTCGHKLFNHGFVRSSTYIAVSQCTSCRCKEFNPVNKEILYSGTLYVEDVK